MKNKLKNLIKGKKCFRCDSIDTISTKPEDDNAFVFGCKKCGLIIVNPTKEELGKLAKLNVDLSNTDILDVGIMINNWRNIEDEKEVKL